MKFVQIEDVLENSLLLLQIIVTKRAAILQ
jgi:hypothetical protein